MPLDIKVFDEIKDVVLNIIHSNPSIVSADNRPTIENALKGSSFDQLPDMIKVALDGLLNILFPPALLIRNNFVADASSFLSQSLNAYRNHIEAAAKASGRIEIRSGTNVNFVGTAWMVAKNIAVTNSHVAEDFSYRQGNNCIFHTGYFGKVTINFTAEHGSLNNNALKFVVKKILHLRRNSNEHDLAFLQINGSNIPTPITLATEALIPTRKICIIGCPVHDNTYPYQRVMQRILAGADTAAVKRIALGQLQSIVQQDRLVHNCSSFKGNSGSVLFAYDIGRAIGLHFERNKNDIHGLPTYNAIPASIINRELQPFLP